jgi:hypothetical protein
VRGLLRFDFEQELDDVSDLGVYQLLQQQQLGTGTTAR